MEREPTPAAPRELRGERVLLRPSEPGDLEPILRWFNDAEMTHFLLSHAPIGREEEERWIARTTSEQGASVVYFVICRLEDRLPIGTVSLFDIDRRRRSAGFGIAVGEKSFWGRRLGTDTTRTIVDFGFRDLELERIWLHVHAYNPRGRRAYEKVGFVVEATARRALYHRGAWHDVLAMAILRSEWEALRAWPGDGSRAPSR